MVAEDALSWDMVKEYDTQTVAEGENPPHVHITQEPPGTPWEVRLGLTLLPARYIARSAIQSLTNSDTPRTLQRMTGINAIRNFQSTPRINQINSLYTQHLRQILSYFAEHNIHPQAGVPGSEQIRLMLENPRFHQLVNQNHFFHSIAGVSDRAFNSIEYAIREYFGTNTGGQIRLTTRSQERIHAAATGMMFDQLYDNALGLGSLYMSWVVRKNVQKEMTSVYSEAVGYELGKDPSKISFEDIRNSDNKIVQSTVQNYDWYQRARFGISLLPFLKNFRPLRFMRFGDFTVGAWGGLWAYDVWGREPTMLETFHNFIKDRLNPLYGIGDKIRSSDILNMYQQYVFKFHPDRSFRTVGLADADETHLWARSEKIFVRVADLMNASYNFKHTAVTDPETGLPKAQAHFALPEFIYLLGHDMINVRQPEWSMLFVEVANRYGMDAVKEAHQAKRTGMDLSEVLKKYPVNLSPPPLTGGTRFAENMETGTSTTKPVEHTAVFSEKALQNIPSLNVHTQGLQQTQLRSSPQHILHS